MLGHAHAPLSIDTMIKRRALMLCAAAVFAVAAPRAQAQTAPAATGDDAVRDAGIPVQSELVRSKCGSCHRTDEKGMMSRISFRRATPENWERTIRRMVTLNHATLEPADARNITKYLADHQGLAPEELRPIAFEEERRLVDYSYKADETTSDLCSSCHSIARVLSERRTKREWELLAAMHRGYYPLVDNQPLNGPQGFMRTRPVQTDAATTDGRPPDNRHPSIRRSSISRRRCRCTPRSGRPGPRPCSRRSSPDDGPSADPRSAKDRSTAK